MFTGLAWLLKFKFSYIGSIAVVPVVFASYYWFINKKARASNYEELPINHPLYQIVDWSRVSDKLRIHVSSSDVKNLPHITRTVNNVFVSSEVIKELDPESLGLLITCYCFKSERTKFEVALLFLSIIVVICLSTVVLIAGKQNAISIMVLAIVLGFVLDILRHARLKREFITYFSEASRSTKCLKAADQMNSKVNERYFWDPQTGIVNRNSLFGKWLRIADEKGKARLSDG